MKSAIARTAFLASLLCLTQAVAQNALPEPGPEDQGLRLRLMVEREVFKGEETFKVRVDLINTTEKSITLTADWPHDSDKGDFGDYLIASIGIQSYPEISDWRPQIMGDSRDDPQPSVALAGGDTLTVEWRASERRLKNGGLRYEANPLRYPTDGLYAVSANAFLQTDGGGVSLRSNEQLVPVGGSISKPKHSVARVVVINKNEKTVILDLGARHKIKVGDQFKVRTGMGAVCTVIVEKVSMAESTGKVIQPPLSEGEDPGALYRFPQRGNKALLVVD